MSERLVHPDHPIEDESGIIWDALQRGAIWITRGKGGEPFEFAAGARAEVKGDASRLRYTPEAHRLILGTMATHPCLAWADALVPVPNGMIDDTNELGRRLEKDVIHMHRPEDAASRYDIRFDSYIDKELAAAAGSVCLIEDLTSTGSTPYEQAKILREVNPKLVVHTLSILHRAPVQLEYQEGENAVVYHTLCAASEPIPLGIDEFVERYGIKPVLVGANEE
jgi:hypothetical protein